MRKLSLFVLTLLCGCVEGQQRVAIPLFVAGTTLTEPLRAAGDIEVQLDRADLAFGPLYLCAGATAGALCDTARAEWLDSVVIDTLSGEAVRAGELSGVSGQVRSYMYDLGISSQLTRSEPFVLDAARALGGASFALEGRAQVNGGEVVFRALIPVQQTTDTELGVPVIRKAATASFSHELASDDSGVVVRFDVRAWVEKVDFAPYAGQSEVTLEPGSEAFRSLRNALFGAGRPSFQWNAVP